MANLTCTCCGSDISAPKFKDGKPYGWACFGKLFGDKGAKPKKFIPVDVAKIESYGQELTIEEILTFTKTTSFNLIIKGEKYTYAFLATINAGRCSAVYQGGRWYVLESELLRQYPKFK